MVKKTADTGKKADANAMLKGLTKNMSKEQMQQLVAAMQQQQMAEMPKHKRYFMQFMQKVGPKMQSAIVHIDNFIGFVTKSSEEGRNDVLQTSRGPILFGMWVAIIFFGFGGMWAAIAPLDSASPASGMVKSSTEMKVITHREGGILREILVKQGDEVKANQPLFVLDDNVARTVYYSQITNYRTLKAEESRLKAERDNLPYIEFSSKLLKDAEKYEVAKILETQKNAFKSRRAFFENREKALTQRIAQSIKHVQALKERKIAAAKTREVLLERLESNQALFEKGLIAKASMAQIEKEYTDAKSNDLSTEAEIMRAEQETTSAEAQLEEFRNQYFADAFEKLKEVQNRLADAKQRFIQAKEALDRTIIRSPVDGIVNKIQPTTIGAVIPQGNPLAEVSPIKDVLIIEAKISPRDIAYLAPGMKAKIRFGAFKSRTTPTFTGVVTSLSPDVVVERSMSQNTENAFYVARIEIDKEEFEADAKRLKLKLLPGMQADIMITRGTRTLLRYLLDPITDNMFKAFKEK